MLVLQVISFIVVAMGPRVHVDTFGTALVGSFIYAIINTILTAILGSTAAARIRHAVQRLMVQRVHRPYDSRPP